MDVKRYYWNQTTIGDGPFDGPGYMSSSSDDPSYDRQVVDASDFDRLTAELAALQSRLNETDAENDRLRGELSQCESMAMMVHEREWAEHVGTGPVSSKVEMAFTQLHNDLHQALGNKHEQQ